MKTSARNQFSGVVAQATAGAVNDEIIINLDEGQQIVATVTHESAARLGLKAERKPSRWSRPPR
ncbi:Molybdenum-pterin binding domain (Dual function transport/regulation) (fragment) (plasmid) [Cupriavidus taiwanensis]|uniref:Molybdenum-pterin binding domain (Dual function transport/regulation) n=1 Tax=Cupriavidus taiwanensis TaxID=164546 RepID=A0A375IQV7_9BURK